MFDVIEWILTVIASSTLLNYIFGTSISGSSLSGCHGLLTGFRTHAHTHTPTHTHLHTHLHTHTHTHTLLQHSPCRILVFMLYPSAERAFLVNCCLSSSVFPIDTFERVPSMCYLTAISLVSRPTDESIPKMVISKCQISMGITQLLLTIMVEII